MHLSTSARELPQAITDRDECQRNALFSACRNNRPRGFEDGRPSGQPTSAHLATPSNNRGDLVSEPPAVNAVPRRISH